MSAEAPVELVLLWHQHQPDYRDPRTGAARLPWVRLHATKDYLEMALRLERRPRVKATFNFVPSLIDQIEAAVAGGADDLFDRIALDPAVLGPEERRAIARRCSQVPPHTLARSKELAALRDAVWKSGGEAVTPEALLALESGFLLAWLDPLFHGEPEAAAALAAGMNPTLAIKDDLLALHARLLAQVIPVHRALRERGQAELSASPYYHPILPLLVDVRTLNRARPDLPAPREPFVAPEDARRQLERAIERHRQVFGAPPVGAWPSEGSVSPEVAEIAAGLGLSWLASDEGVLRRSFDHDPPAGAAYAPWRIETPAGSLALFFRDRELSDRIGFVYQRWDPREAAGDFLERLRRIGRDHGGETPAVVSVMLDGENCWEGYPEDGGPFLEALYDALEQATDIRTATPADVLARRPDLPKLDRLHSGSWIDADFHIWAGHPEKNRAWDLLSRARAMLVARPDPNPAAWEALMRAEGSDWFWWFGDDHYTADKPAFDALFRGHLRSIYESCAVPVPVALGVPVAAPAAAPGTRRAPVGYLQPVIDGRQTHFYEWQPAGRWTLTGGGAMHATAASVGELYYGFDQERLFLRLDFVSPQESRRALRIEVLEPLDRRIEVESLGDGAPGVTRVEADGTRIPIGDAACRVAELLELAIPLAALGIRAGDSVQMLIQIVEEGRPIESLPPGDALRFRAPDESFDVSVWYP